MDSYKSTCRTSVADFFNLQKIICIFFSGIPVNTRYFRILFSGGFQKNVWKFIHKFLQAFANNFKHFSRNSPKNFLSDSFENSVEDSFENFLRRLLKKSSKDFSRNFPKISHFLQWFFFSDIPPAMMPDIRSSEVRLNISKKKLQRFPKNTNQSFFRNSSGLRKCFKISNKNSFTIFLVKSSKHTFGIFFMGFLQKFSSC